MTSKTIPLFRAYTGKEELQNVKKVLESQFLGKWKYTEKFEKEFAKFVDAKYCVGTNSGTAALHLALMACGIKKGDEVLVPNLTFVSTALVVLYVGAKPVWVDVNPDTLCIDSEDVRRKITKRTRAIIPVCYGGQPVEIKKIKRIIKEVEHKFDIKIWSIIDAAQAAGSRYDNGKRVGCCQHSDLTIFSFEAKKPATCGQSGAVTTNNKELAKKIERLSWLGINKGTKERMAGGYNWQYDVVDVNGYCGYKYHMSDIEASILLAQLKKLDWMNAERRKIVKRYDEAFKNISWIKTLKRSKNSACWNYAMILTDTNNNNNNDIEIHFFTVGWMASTDDTATTIPDISRRKDFIEYMIRKKISVGVHYQLLNSHTVFKKHKKADTPNANEIWSNIVVLPVFVGLTRKQQDYIIKCVKEFGRKTGYD